MSALKEKWLTKRELNLIMEKSEGLENQPTIHSPFPAGTKLGKLVTKGKDLADANESEDSSLLADAKSAGYYNVTRVKVTAAESQSLQSCGPESETNQRRRGKNGKDKRKK